ncbi:unnamed protein product [Peniophora sp. CBMAI 1063]|nr:unnamed protein product [Peniophora sp. CBMAI 1063]
MRSSPNDLLDICANLLPMRLLVAKICFRALTRVSALPVNHPLHLVAIRSAAAFPRVHRTPLHYLYRLFPEAAPQHSEYIVPMRYDPAHLKPTFTTHIAKSREESHREDEDMDSVIRVYSDGSGYNGYAGAAAVLIRTDGVHEQRRVLRYRLGPLTEHTVYEAEAVGVLLGAHLLHTEEPEHASKPSSISLDNQAVIRATEHCTKAQPGHYLLDLFRDSADRLLQKRRLGYSLAVRWISGHDDAEFNEYVDGQAKIAADGRSSVKTDLPHCLRTPLRASVSALRQEYARRLKERWQRDWCMSPRYHRHCHWAPDATSPRHIAITNELSRRDSTVLFQLRSGHAPLNAHLHRINCAPAPTCEACEEADETVNHFIYDCPARLSERRQLRKAAGKKWADRSYLLGETRGVKALMAYVRQTGRLRWGRRQDSEGRPEERTGPWGLDRRRDETGREEERLEDDDSMEVERLVEDEDEEDEGGGLDMAGFMRWYEGFIGDRGEGGETQRERDAATDAD